MALCHGRTITVINILSRENPMHLCFFSVGVNHITAVAGGVDIAVLTGHRGAVSACCFLHSLGQPSRIATASKDKTVKIWDLEDRSVVHQSAILVSPFMPHSLNSLAANCFSMINDTLVFLWIDFYMR